MTSVRKAKLKGVRLPPPLFRHHRPQLGPRAWTGHRRQVPTLLCPPMLLLRPPMLLLRP